MYWSYNCYTCCKFVCVLVYTCIIHVYVHVHTCTCMLSNMSFFLIRLVLVWSCHTCLPSWCPGLTTRQALCWYWGQQMLMRGQSTIASLSHSMPHNVSIVCHLFTHYVLACLGTWPSMTVPALTSTQLEGSVRLIWEDSANTWGITSIQYWKSK